MEGSSTTGKNVSDNHVLRDETKLHFRASLKEGSQVHGHGFARNISSPTPLAGVKHVHVAGVTSKPQNKEDRWVMWYRRVCQVKAELQRVRRGFPTGPG